MDNQFIEFTTSDLALDEIFNTKVVIPGNELIGEHNTHVGNTSNPHSVTKANVGLGNVDNTADASKPVSTAQQEAIDLKVSKSDYVKSPGYATATGTANTYAITLDPIPSAYVDGMGIVVKINAENTGASTLNVNSLGAKSILDSKGNAMTAGKLKAGTPYTLRYNGTNFIIQGEGASGNATASDLISGKTATVDAGEITGTLDLSLLTADNLRKNITINGVTGNKLEYGSGDSVLKEKVSANYTTVNVGGATLIATLNTSKCSIDLPNSCFYTYTQSDSYLRKYDLTGALIWQVFMSMTVQFGSYDGYGINSLCNFTKDGDLLIGTSVDVRKVSKVNGNILNSFTHISSSYYEYSIVKENPYSGEIFLMKDVNGMAVMRFTSSLSQISSGTANYYGDICFTGPTTFYGVMWNSGSSNTYTGKYSVSNMVSTSTISNATVPNGINRYYYCEDLNRVYAIGLEGALYFMADDPALYTVIQPVSSTILGQAGTASRIHSSCVSDNGNLVIATYQIYNTSIDTKFVISTNYGSVIQNTTFGIGARQVSSLVSYKGLLYFVIYKNDGGALSIYKAGNYGNKYLANYSIL